MPLSQKKLQLFLLILLIAVAISFRFWQIRDYVVFLGDEGRDMIVMRNIFTEKKLPFLGPTASVGGFYLGPIYYWMAAPFLLLSGFDPVGPSYMVALLGIFTVFLLYKFLKVELGFWPAILASSLYAVAPLVVRYSRSSWNPNPLPFFSLLLIYLIYLGIKRKNLVYFLGAGASFGICIQLHYLASILLAISAVIILLNTNYKQWLKIVLASLGGFFITFSPFLLFEIRHNFPNFTTISEFVTRESTHGFKGLNFARLISGIGNTFLEDISGLKGTVITKYIFWILAGVVIWAVFNLRKDKDKKLIFSIGAIWFLGGLAGLKFYAGQVYDYYFGFMFPAPFLLLGILFYLMWDKFILKIAAVVVSVTILTFFIANGFYKTEPNRLIDQTEIISDFVIEKSEGQPFNFALISNSNSNHAYRYFLEIKGFKPTLLEDLITDQLLIVCESNPCPSPLGHPLWEIAAFGRGEVAGEWDLPRYGFKIYRLTHWPGAPNPAGKPATKGI